MLQATHKSPSHDNPSCSFAQDGKIVPMSSYLCSKTNNNWIIDSGASDHMTGNSSLYISCKPCAGNRKVRIADGSFSAIAGIGESKSHLS